MAPHADDTIVDTSGYMPSDDTVRELKKSLRLHHTQSITKNSWISGGPQTIDSHDRDGEYEACILQLSLNELQEIEDAVNFFEGLFLSTYNNYISSLTENQAPSFLLTNYKQITFLCQPYHPRSESSVYYCRISSHTSSFEVSSHSGSASIRTSSFIWESRVMLVPNEQWRQAIPLSFVSTKRTIPRCLS